MNVDAVVFDIGNVLIEWQPERFFDGVLGRERREAFFNAIDLHGMNERVDLGENFTAVLDATRQQHPEWKAELDIWHDRWLEMAAPAIPASVDLMSRLRSNGVPVFALSNFGVETFAIAEAEYDFLTWFDRRYISGHMRLVKPDPKIYRSVEEDCGVAPERLLFADDRADNIEAAASRGWQTHLFKEPAEFAERLQREGLLK